MWKFINYLKGNILVSLSIFALVFGVLQLFQSSKENFVIEVESDIYNINLQNIKYPWELHLKNLRQEIITSREIKGVDLKFILPNKLQITTEKRKPFAVWWDYNKFFLVDEDGVIISDSVSDKEKKTYILVVGGGALENLKALTDSLLSSNYNGKVASMRFVGGRRWDLVLSDGMLVKLPEKGMNIALSILDRLLKNKGGLISKDDIVDMRLAPKKVFFKRQSDVKKQ